MPHEPPQRDDTAPLSHDGVTGSRTAAAAAVLAARRYEPLDEIARGGAGRIRRARDLAFDRIVAIKEPLDPERGGARLRAEAEILARLQHPSIIPVYDAGVRDDGIPFFAMKLVDGGSLREAIAAAPTLEQRLALIPEVAAVAEAIAYAHAQGVIHRDIKPANVLLGAFGEIMVIDWGLAKRIAGGPADAAALNATTTGTVKGTPAYMAPEQARGERIDARADVYAIGAMLYQVLTGVAPFGDRSASEVLDAAALEHPEPVEQLQPRAPADLVAITRRAMARDPADRYATAAQIAGDLRRFQTGRLVSARRYSPVARARRWLRKRRGAITAAAVAAVAAVGVAELTRAPAGVAPAVPCEQRGEPMRALWDPAHAGADRSGAIRAALVAGDRPGARAVFARVAAQLDDHARSWMSARVESCESHARGDQSDTLFDLRERCLELRSQELAALVEVLANRASPVPLDKVVEAAARLAPVTACADVDALSAVMPLPGDPARRAQIDQWRQSLATAEALEDTGSYKDALPIAVQVAAATGGGYPPVHAEALYRRARLEDRTGDSKAAEHTLEQALLAAADGRHDALAPRIWADLLFVIGERLSRPDEALRLRPAAEAALHRAVSPAAGASVRTSAAGPFATSDPDAAARLWNTIGALFAGKGTYPEAQTYFERALAIRERAFGPDHVDVAASLSAVARVLSARDRNAEALACLERALAIFEHAYAEHPSIAMIENNRGLVLVALGRDGDAQRSYERALAIRERTLGPTHPQIASTLVNLANVRQRQGKFDGAQPDLERAIAILEQRFGPQHRNLGIALANLGSVLFDQGDVDGARPHLDRAVAIGKLLPEHPDLAIALTHRGDVLRAQHHLDDARRDQEQALAIWRKALGDDHPDLAYALTGLAEILLAQRRPHDARPHAARAVELRNAGRPLDLARSQLALAQAMWATPRDRPAAVELTRRARDTIAATGEAGRRALPDVDAWLRTHR